MLLPIFISNNNIIISVISNYHFQVQFAWEHHWYCSPVNDGNTSLVNVFVYNWSHTIIHCLYCLICFIHTYTHVCVCVCVYVISALNIQSKLFGLGRLLFLFYDMPVSANNITLWVYLCEIFLNEEHNVNIYDKN